MLGYWLKNRLALDVAFCILLVLLLAFGFMSPILGNLAEAAAVSAPYENERLDFDVPAPADHQIAELRAKSFIESVFPYYFTKINVSFGNGSRETNLLLFDPEQSLESTMYSDGTLIARMDARPANPMYVDYAFVTDTGAQLGDTVTVTLGARPISFTVYQINEANSYYNGGAVMVEWAGEQKAAVTAASPSIKYSGAFIEASDHAACKSYLDSDYRALGRLKDESEFESAEAYSIHLYNIMSASCRNEITDFSAKRTDANTAGAALGGSNTALYIFAGVISVILVALYSFALWWRSSERGYFARRKMSGDTGILAYYLIASSALTALLFIGVAISLCVIPAVMSAFVPYDGIAATAWIFVVICLASSAVSFLGNVLLEKRIRG